MSNCRAHSGLDSLPELKINTFEYLLSCTTSEVLFLDAGAKSWEKEKYCRCLLYCIFDNIDSGCKSIYTVEVLKAIWCTCAKWRPSLFTFMSACFDHYFKTTAEAGNTLTGDDMLDEMDRDDNVHSTMVKESSLKVLLNQEHENCVIENMTLGGVAQKVADELVNTTLKSSQRGVKKSVIQTNSRCILLSSLRVVYGTIKTLGHIQKEVEM